MLVTSCCRKLARIFVLRDVADESWMAFLLALPGETFAAYFEGISNGCQRMVCGVAILSNTVLDKPRLSPSSISNRWLARF